MAKKRLLVEFGMGSSLRRRDYTEAARRALKDALWHNSISLAELLDTDKSQMIIDATVAVQQPEKVDCAALAETFPYGIATVVATKGGLDVPKPDGSGVTVIANAAIEVSFDLTKVTN